jgi:hypothetical protein
MLAGFTATAAGVVGCWPVLVFEDLEAAEFEPWELPLPD